MDQAGIGIETSDLVGDHDVILGVLDDTVRACLLEERRVRGVGEQPGGEEDGLDVGQSGEGLGPLLESPGVEDPIDTLDEHVRRHRCGDSSGKRSEGPAQPLGAAAGRGQQEDHPSVDCALLRSVSVELEGGRSQCRQPTVGDVPCDVQ